MKIVYHSFFGRYSDSPRALFERLSTRSDLDQVWLAESAHQHNFPAEVTTVPVGSSEAVEALESADVVIANTHTEVEWTKRPGSTYLQTWHGTPLKRIHHDVLWAPAGRLARLDRDIAKWDLLLSPNAVSTPRLRQAFAFEGEILETGYPRNDVLSAPDRDSLRTMVRKELGLSDDVTAVLYTPTWRDDECFQDGAPDVPMALDFQQFTERLGKKYRLLARSHNMMTGRSTPADLPGVIDVSYYPDIRDLYLAADVLVTDYSSAMFDFAVTGKPIVLYAYDLDRFRDTVRGFYFDLAPAAPGPIVRTTAELVEAIGEVSAVQDVERYARFAATFCHLEDGHATQRVLDRLRICPSQAGGARR